MVAEIWDRYNTAEFSKVISDAYPCNWEQDPIHKSEDKINNI